MTCVCGWGGPGPCPCPNRRPSDQTTPLIGERSGWICSRCGTSNAPWMPNCMSCKPAGRAALEQEAKG